MNDKESLIESIESSEGILHKRSERLREYLFTSDEYNYNTIIELASDIRLIADIIIESAKQLNKK